MSGSANSAWATCPCARAPGRVLVLPAKVEENLAKNLLFLYERHCPVSVASISSIVCSIVKGLGLGGEEFVASKKWLTASSSATRSWQARVHAHFARAQPALQLNQHHKVVHGHGKCATAVWPRTRAWASTPRAPP